MLKGLWVKEGRGPAHWPSPDSLPLGDTHSPAAASAVAAQAGGGGRERMPVRDSLASSNPRPRPVQVL